MTTRKRIVFWVAIVVVITTALATFHYISSRSRTYRRKTVAGVECLVDSYGHVVSCNWGKQ